MGRVYVGDIGTIIEIDMQQDISTATSVALYVKKPDTTEVTWTPTVYNNNYLRYTLVSGDVDIAGVYKIQPYVEFTDWKGMGNTVEFTVYEKYQ